MDDVTRGFGTGSLPHQPDARDFDMARLPGVAEMLAGALPSVVDHSAFVYKILNQGSLPSCVAHSSVAAEMLYRNREGGFKDTYDPVKVYYDVGGDGVRGVPSARVLQYAQEQGFPIVSSDKRTRIGSYAFTRDLNVVCAAIAAGHVCVIAMMLPTDWWKGDSAGGSYTTNYHQVLVSGYDRREDPLGRLRGPNSWGTSFGVNGFYSVPSAFLLQNNNQGGAFYSYTTVDFLDGGAAPDPVRVIVGIETLAGVPINRITSGDRYLIRGKGFGAKAGQVLEGSVATGMRNATAIDLWSDTEIRVTAGKFTADFDNGNITVLGPATTAQDTFILTRENVQFRSGAVIPIPSPTPKPAISEYRSTTSTLIGSIGVAENREIEIVFDSSSTANFLNRPMRAFWGTQEMTIVGKLLPNRLRVRLPSILVSQSLPVAIVMQDDQTSIQGKPLTIRNTQI